MDASHIHLICQRIRASILTSTTHAQSGHPSSSLSAVELVTTLFFGGYFHADFNQPQLRTNDKIIFSKGHACPLLYSLYHELGYVSSDELMSLRSFGSVFEGHPTPRFSHVDVATGSLGQGLSMGVGMALGVELRIKKKEIRIEKKPHIFVLLGDSEMAEGQNWEAMQIASYYNLNNLVGILDVNRLGQQGETMLGWDIESYKKRIESFGWNTIIIKDGHNIQNIISAYSQLTSNRQPSTDHRPTMFIAKTVKGKGVSIWENKNGFHAKSLSEEQLEVALKELGKINDTKRDTTQTQKISKPDFKLEKDLSIPDPSFLVLDSLYSTRETYGDAVLSLGKTNNKVVVLDAEVSNSTRTDLFKKAYPERFFEMFIAEQNMLSTAVGISKMDFLPYVSTFTAFLTRAFDQIRMAQYSEADMVINGSYCGVSTGKDGPTGMGVEDISMMRSILESTVLYPSDAVSAWKLTLSMANMTGIRYIRTTREKLPILYPINEEFPIGKLKILKESEKDSAVVIGAGITVHESLEAYEELKKKGIFITVVDLYSIKPIDTSTLCKLAKKTPHMVVVEDHYPTGGIGEAVLSALSKDNSAMKNLSFSHLCVRKLPCSGKPKELLHYEEIDSQSIIKTILS